MRRLSLAEAIRDDNPAATPVPFAPVIEKYYVPDEMDLIKEVKKIIG